MYNLIYFLLLNINLSFGTILIRNRALPVCSNCLHFIEHTNNYPYDPIPNSKEYGQCKKFGEVNLITGVIEYDFAKNCRNDIGKCGKQGLQYMEKIKF